MAYTLERCFVIRNEDTCEHIEIGDDRDSLGLTEIRFIGCDGAILTAVSFTSEEIPLIIKALRERLARIEPISSEDEIPLLIESLRDRFDEQGPREVER